jgi:exonuclease III
MEANPILMDLSPEVLIWNVCGMNYPAKKSVLREFLSELRVSIVCFQETKLVVIDDFIIMQSLGPSFNGFSYLPAIGTRGGILLCWDTSVVQITNLSFDTHAITEEVRTNNNSNNRWWITLVYGPQATEDKVNFLSELKERSCLGPWMVAGDFNMILYASEKNNESLDRNMMARLQSFVQELELKDLYMHGRRFTRSNEREVLTRYQLVNAYGL